MFTLESMRESYNKNDKVSCARKASYLLKLKTLSEEEKKEVTAVFKETEVFLSHDGSSRACRFFNSIQKK